MKAYTPFPPELMELAEQARTYIDGLDKVYIQAPADVAMFMLPDLCLEQEHFWVLLLNTRNRVTKKHLLYVGSTDGCSIHVGEVFREAVRENARGVIFVHNHPSGDVGPSLEDIQLTTTLVKAGSLLDIHVLDHVIVSGPKWFSLKEKGLGFEGG